MWYNTIPTISAAAWLSQVVDLFNDTLQAIMGQPLLASFVGFGVLMLAFGLFALFRRGAGPRGRRADGLHGL